MKTEDLKAQGLTQEQIDFVFAEHGKELNPIKQERDNYKTQYEQAKSTLDGFKDVDVSKLQEKVTQLTNDLAAKDAEHQKAIADMTFQNVLDEAIRTSGAKNSKAVAALLDIDKLKGSKNQSADIAEAIKAVKAENDYLFQSEKPVPKVVSSTPGPNKHAEDVNTRANNALRSILGKE